MKTEILAIVLSVGDNQKEVADKLRAIAYQIETEGTYEYSDGTDKTMVWESKYDGEIPLFGRYFGVGYDKKNIDPPTALFMWEKDALAYANGGVYEDEDDKPSTDGIITRCDVVMTTWNSFDLDPVKRSETMPSQIRSYKPFGCV